MRLRGGGAPLHVFSDVSNENYNVEKKFSYSGPDWRIVTKGLNLHGICHNESCKAFEKEVICRQGLGVFDLM